MKTRVLITGATGFIGSHLTKYLTEHPDFCTGVLRRPSSREMVVDCSLDGNSCVLSLDDDAGNIEELFRDFKPDVVIHLATLFLSAHRDEDLEPLITSNILFGTKVLEAMSATGVKHFINTGTNWEGFGSDQGYNPANLYAATKKAFEDILHYYVSAHDVNAIGFKLFDTYGPFDPRRKLFYILKDHLKTKEPLEFSGAEQDIDLVYIDDIVRAYEQGIKYLLKRESRDYETFYIGSGKKMQVKDVIRVFEEVYEDKLNIKLGKRPYRPREVMTIDIDVRPTHEKLAWDPKVSLKEGLRVVRELEQGAKR